MNTSNKEAMSTWLKVNPGKTKRDWLIEKRCTTDTQRDALNEILDQCDDQGVAYEIGLEVNIPNEYNKYLSEISSGISFVGEIPMIGATPVDFSNFNSCLERKFKETKNFDLFFPSVGWYINIGEEINEAVERLKGGLIWNDARISNEDISFNIETMILMSLNKEFNRYLNKKYKLPIEKDKNEKPELLPWNYDIEKSEIPDRLLKIGIVYSFLHRLFNDNFQKVKEQIVSNRREKFLSANPDIQKQRAEMLHTLVIGMQREKGNYDSPEIHEIKDLLKTVDKELYLLYPEYHKLSII